MPRRRTLLTLAAIDRAVSDSSFWTLTLLRFSPAVPFGLLNYALAGARLPWPRRIGANVLGMGLCNLIQAYIGSMLAGVGGLSDAAPSGPWKWLLLAGGIGAAAIAFVVTGLASKRVLAHEA